MTRTIKDRIAEFVEYKGISMRSFERNANISNGYINNIKASPSSTVLQKIINTYEELNPLWLTTGVGEMLKSEVSNNTTPSSKVGIPLIPLSAMAGNFIGENSVLECECERYIIPAFQGADFLIHVKGDSMLPSYKSGDIVACKRVPMERLFFQWNHTYVLDTDQGALIKRIKEGTDNDHVLIVSDNDEYTPFELPVSCIYGVALVIGIIRLE